MMPKAYPAPTTGSVYPGSCTGTGMSPASATGSQVAYRDFPVFTAPLTALDGAHKTRVPSCNDLAQVPMRKIRLNAGIVQPRSGDAAAFCFEALRLTFTTIAPEPRRVVRCLKPDVLFGLEVCPHSPDRGFTVSDSENLQHVVSLLFNHGFGKLRLLTISSSRF